MVTLFVCGDVMLGRGIDQILPRPCDPVLHESYMRDARGYIAIAEEVSGPIPREVPPEYPWGEALGILEAAQPDARVINLETSITHADAYDRGKGIHYRMSPENSSCLTAAGIDVCVLGNNHVLDWGTVGLLDTVSTLDALGIAHAGAGRDRGEALAPAVIELPDNKRIVVFSAGCTDGGVPARWSAGAGYPGVHVIDDLGDDTVKGLCDLIEPWKRDDTFIVLSLHWGPNWGFEVDPAHRTFAHRMIDEVGVHVLHGHSSHHVKGIEVYRGHPILYGCGDLLTDYEGIRSHEQYRGDLGLLYFVTLDAAGALSRLEMAPTQMCQFRLISAGPREVGWLTAVLVQAGRRLGTSVLVEGNQLSLRW